MGVTNQFKFTAADLTNGANQVIDRLAVAATGNNNAFNTLGIDIFGISLFVGIG